MNLILSKKKLFARWQTCYGVTIYTTHNVSIFKGKPSGGLHVCSTPTPMAMHSRSHLHNRCPNPTLIFEQFTCALYDNCLKHFSKGKTPCMDNIPYDILKIIPDIFHDMLFLFSTQYYLQHSILYIWKHSNIIHLHKKIQPHTTPML